MTNKIKSEVNNEKEIDIIGFSDWGIVFLASCFKAKTYTIEFNSMGGQAVEQLTYKKGEIPNLPTQKKKVLYFQAGT